MTESNEHQRKEEASERALAQALAELPSAVEPQRDLWAGVSSRIAAKERRSVLSHRVATGAAVLLAAASVALAIVAAPGPVATNEPARSQPVLQEHSTSIEDAAPLFPEEVAYHAALATLRPAFEQHARDLPAASRQAIDGSLAAIDAAIGATRASLEEAPDDADLRAELDDEYEQKIQTMNDVLDWTTRS